MYIHLYIIGIACISTSQSACIHILIRLTRADVLTTLLQGQIFSILLIMIVGKIEDYNSSSLHPPISTYYFVDQDGEEFIIEETIHLPVQLDLSTLSHYHQLFHNGESISSSGTKYNTSISVSEGSVIKVVLVIRNITEDDSGLYTTPVLTAIHELLFTDSLGCRNAHDYFHFFVFDLSLSQISMGMVTFSVEKYSKFQ